MKAHARLIASLVAGSLLLLTACAGSFQFLSLTKPDLTIPGIDVNSIQKMGGVYRVAIRFKVRNRSKIPPIVNNVNVVARVNNPALQPGPALAAGVSVGRPDGLPIIEVQGTLQKKETRLVDAVLWVTTPWPGAKHKLILDVDAPYPPEQIPSKVDESNENNNRRSVTIFLPEV